MEFLAGERLRHAIEKLSKAKRLRFAVAFWGTGSEVLVSEAAKRDIRIICNLKAGGTNPYVIENFPPAIAVKQHDHLHAKVYIGENEAIVTSANASANGLGLEGNEQEFWEEAGILIDGNSIKAVDAWFEDMWRASRAIQDRDLESAKVAWRARRAVRPPLRSFADFDVNAPDLPLIDYYGNEEWKTNPALTKGMTQEAIDNLEDRISAGREVEGDADRAALTPGRWVTCFTVTARDLPNRRTGLEWVHLGPILENAFRYPRERKYRPVALASEAPPSEPFSVQERLFFDTFLGVIKHEKYKALRTGKREGAWFIDARLKLMKDFWRELKAQYLKEQARVKR